MKVLISLLAICLLSNCKADKSIESQNNSESVILQEFQQLGNESILNISKEDEPGDPLILCLTFVNVADNKPLATQQVKFYHTSNSGIYEPNDLSDESTTRLNGDAVTDSLGRILVYTILPGDYGSSENNRHIHTTVFDAKPEAYDIHFRQFTSFMGKDFIEGSNQHFLANLKYNSDSTLITFLTNEIKNPVTTKT